VYLKKFLQYLTKEAFNEFSGIFTKIQEEEVSKEHSEYKRIQLYLNE